MIISDFIRDLPKAELHLHIEGTFEPELMFAIAHRNGVELPYKSVEELRGAYNFSNLQDFLDIYYQGMNVLLKEEDFFDLTKAYLDRVAAQGVKHVEIFFDPQGHTHRGIEFKTVVDGIWRGLEAGQEQHGISFGLIMCFLRHLDEESAFETLQEALPFKDKIIAVGLDSSEQGHPPSKFERVFAKARQEGFRCVAHTGEEGPPEYIKQAIDLLKIDRIDHGNRCLEDTELTQRLAEMKIPFTVCPLSNLKLCVIDRIEDHPLPEMLKQKLNITLNSDDPAFFGGYIAENFQAMQDALGLSNDTMTEMARNSFTAAFLSDEEKAGHGRSIDKFLGK
ncbi:MAG: adenosine deaminase [Parasphingorhabdus sp.]|jgi:adenosine deaminase